MLQQQVHFLNACYKYLHKFSLSVLQIFAYIFFIYITYILVHFLVFMPVTNICTLYHLLACYKYFLSYLYAYYKYLYIFFAHVINICYLMPKHVTNICTLS